MQALRGGAWPGGRLSLGLGTPSAGAFSFGTRAGGRINKRGDAVLRDRGVKMDQNSMVRASLGELVMICRNAHDGFQAAAKHLQAEELKILLAQFASQSAVFADELQAVVQRRTEAAAVSESEPTGAMLHRGWINLEAAAASGSAYEVLAECARGEESTLATYKRVLLREFPADIRQVLETQLTAVRATHECIKALRDAELPW